MSARSFEKMLATPAARAPEARTFAETEELVRSALREKYQVDGDGVGDRYVWVRDITDDWVAFGLEGTEDPGVYKADYTIAENGDVTFGDAVKVQPRTEYEVVEAQQRVAGRVLEAKGTDAAGGRVFHVRIIEAGDSKNGNRYPIGVVSAAAHMYEGAKAFDHHRTVEEIETSTVAGLVGHYRNVEADDTGLVGDLHLLPGATHVAEALDASIDAQTAGLAPVVGISHDVIANWQVTTESSRQFREATQIVRVLSADVVADPAAGGKAIRMVAGGPGTVESDPNHKSSEEDDMPKTLAELLAEATDADKDALRALLDGDASTTTTATTTETETETTETEENEDDKVLVGAGAVERDSLTARGWIREATSGTGLTVEQVTEFLPDRVTESTVSRAIGQIRKVAEGIEKRTLTPSTTPNQITVGAEHVDKARERVYQTLCGNFQEGYTSYFDMFEDVTGERVRPDIDGAQRIVREAWDAGRMAGRTRESVETSTFAQVLGDSVARRMVDVYKSPQYQSWRKIATPVPVRDFREQKLTRLGGYGDLPAVAQGGAYQPLTTPGDEEATYTVSKRGGTEDLTMESVKNDDMRALVRIPTALGRAAARTLHKFVWVTNFSANPTCTYDSTALFAAGHSNTTAVALSHAGVNSLRQKMRDQAEFGESTDPLGLVPKFLIVPNELEDLAHQITQGARAIPATTPGATDVPNLHQGMEAIVVDEFTDANDWYLACDPMDCPIIEIGFLDGRQDPELFMQDDPRVGAVFSSDKVTWKIRHIYSGTPVDHRGVQRGTQ